MAELFYTRSFLRSFFHRPISLGRKGRTPFMLTHRPSSIFLSDDGAALAQRFPPASASEGTSLRRTASPSPRSNSKGCVPSFLLSKGCSPFYSTWCGTLGKTVRASLGIRERFMDQFRVRPLFTFPFLLLLLQRGASPFYSFLLVTW